MEVLRTPAIQFHSPGTIATNAAILDLLDSPGFLADDNGRILAINQTLKNVFKSKNIGELSLSDPGIVLRIAEGQDANKSQNLRGWLLVIRSGVSMPCELKKLDDSFLVGIISTVKPKTDQGLRILLENEQLGVVVCESDGIIINTNPAFCRLIGFSREELLGQDLNSFATGKNTADIADRLSRYAADHKFTSVNEHYTLTHKLGQEVNASVCINKLQQDRTGEIEFVFTFTDTSDSEKARIAISRREQKLNAIFDNSRDGIAVLDMAEDKISTINPAGCSIFDLGPESIPVLLGNARIEPDQKHKDIFSWLMKVARKPNKEGVEQLRGKGGKPKYIKTYRHALYNDDDRHQVVIFNDVTDDIIVREMAIEQENQLKLFVRHIPLPIAMFDRNMNYLLVSEKWKETNSGDFHDLIGQNHYSVNPNLPKRFIESHKKALEGEIVGCESDYYVNEDGIGVYLRWEARPWYNSYNEIGGILLVSENVTDQIMADRVLKDHELRFRSVFESGSVGWLEADIQDTYKYVVDLRANGVKDIDKFLNNLDINVLFPHFKVINYNKQIERLFGLKDTDVLKELRLYKMILDPEELLKRELKAIFNQESSFDTEFVIINRDGEEKFIHLSVNYPQSEDYSRVIYGVLDVTDQRKQTYKLRESEERYRTMIENNHLGVIYRNRETKETLLNEAFENIFGYNLEEVNQLSELQIMVEDYHDLSRENFARLKAGEVSSYNMETAYYHKNGSIVFTNTTVTGLYTDKGAFYGTVTMIEDVSEKRDIRQKLKEQNEELLKINEELDQFVYSAAHDLRAPIANVLGLIKLMKFEEMSDKLSGYVDLQENSLTKLDDFIKSIVNYSQNARLELHLEEIQLETMVNDVLDQYRYLDNAQEMDISLNVNQDSAFISDQKRLNIVMNNLISNAIRYSDPTKLQSYIKVTVNADKDGATFIIEDNGKGIEEGYIDKIFQLFYRADTSSKGTGIGLYLVKETVKKLYGSIEVKSEFKEWTRFTIFLKNLI